MTSIYVSIDINVDAVGPLFDGLAEAEMERYARHVEDTLGDMGVSMIRAYLPTQYMYLGHHGGTPEFNPVPPNAGELVAAIHTIDVGDSVMITDDPVTYGPWIEGIDNLNLVVWPHRRNPPARRFPGYHTFRKIGESLNAMATPIAIRELPPYIAAMNGKG